MKKKTRLVSNKLNDEATKWWDDIKLIKGVEVSINLLLAKNEKDG